MKRFRQQNIQSPCSLKKHHAKMRLKTELGDTARMVVALRREVIECKELSKLKKPRIFSIMVVPTLLHVSKTWTLEKR